MSLLYIIVLGLCSGIALTLLFGFGFTIALVLLCAAGAALLGAKTHTVYLVSAIFLSSLVLGILRADFFLWSESQKTIPQHIGSAGIVEGIVSDDPDRRDTSVHLTIAVSHFNGRAANGLLLAQVPVGTDAHFGDFVRVRGPLEAPQAFAANGGRQFDYPGYLRVRGISTVMPRATILDDRPGSWSVRGFLFSLKHTFEEKIQAVFPEEQGALLEGLLLGERRGLPQATTDAFVAAGLVHVVVLSGYNITIVSEAVLRGLSFLPEVFSYSLGSGIMILFAAMTGGGATTVRAVIMALIAIVARYMRRPAVALRSLSFAGAVLVLWNPLSLLYDPSFILSFLATFGLITLSPAVESNLLRLPLFSRERFKSVRSIAASTISVQLFVLPALLYFTGVLSVISLPANILALPAVPFAMGLGFFSGIFGFIHPALAYLPAIMGNLLLTWVLLVAYTSTSIPFASIIVPSFPAWVAALAYIPLCASALWLYRKIASVR